MRKVRRSAIAAELGKSKLGKRRAKTAIMLSIVSELFPDVSAPDPARDPPGAALGSRSRFAARRHHIFARQHPLRRVEQHFL